MPTVVYEFKIGETLTDATTCVLSDVTATYGVKRNDTDAVVVVDGTAMTKLSTGVYVKNFVAPAANLVYTYAVEAVYNAITYRKTGTIDDGSGYNTLAELKVALDITGSDRDTELTSMIQDVKSLIDTYCHRKFDTVTEVRYFDAGKNAFIDDLVSASEIAVDDGSRTWADVMSATDYDLMPLNKSPKTWLRLAVGSEFTSFGECNKSVKITGTWGFASVPENIHRASLMWVTILEMGRKAGYSNTIGSTDTGVITIDRDPPTQVKKILEQYVKHF